MNESNKIERINKMYANQGNSFCGLDMIINEFHLFRKTNVYHYTDIAGFISIMLQQELWASHIAFMNDRLEYLHGKELFRKKLLEKLNCVQEAEQSVLQNVLRSLDKEVSDSIIPTSGKDVFSISFTYNSDSLEMWRGYGKETGIAIGFDWSKCHSLPGISLIRKENYEKLLNRYNNKTEEVCPERNLYFNPIAILYEDDKKIELVERVIKMGLDCFCNLNTGSEHTYTAILIATQFLSDLIFKITPYLKHRGFKGEKECRFVDNFTAYGQEENRIYYRNRSGIILPYVKYKIMDLNCRPLNQIPISEIVVGPGLKQQRTEDSVKYFLEKNNMNYLVDKVRASTIPYEQVY